ncbi:MAG: hypothetical protein H7Y02_08275 [Candidatus Obscuribacterales bacterium]|nr:hypothetical protein [Steroidobacteraceae bacterium]
MYSTLTSRLTGIRTQVIANTGFLLSLLLCLMTLPRAHAGEVIDAPPTISGQPSTTVQINQRYYFRPSASDAEGATLTFSIVNKPTWASFSAYSGRLRGTPTTAGITSNIIIRVSDGASTVSLPAFSISVLGGATNTPPVISGTPSTSVVAGSAYSFQPTASDANGNALTFAVTNRPAWATFDGATGRLSGTPTAAATHSSIVISVSDGIATTSLPAFSITVTATPNSAPVISGSPSTSVVAGSAYSFQPTASDANGNALTFAVTNRPAWATFSTSTGRLSGTPTAAATHSSIVISVSDGIATTSLPAFSLTVTATPNSAPVISGTPTTSLNAGTAYSFRPTASDPDGNTLTFSIANAPSWALFNAATGQLSRTPSASHVGTYANIVISVSDGSLTRSLPAFSIAVNQISLGSAALSWTPPTQNTDGSALTNLAGYRIYYGTSTTALDQTVQLNGSGLTAHIIGNLSPATYYFAIAAYNTGGTESVRSQTLFKVIN